MALTENEGQAALMKLLYDCRDLLASRLVSDARFTVLLRLPESLPEEAAFISNDRFPLAIAALEHQARLQKQRGGQ